MSVLYNYYGQELELPEGAYLNVQYRPECLGMQIMNDGQILHNFKYNEREERMERV